MEIAKFKIKQKKMEPSIQPKKIIQQSEQIFNPVKIPIIIDNQIYLMVQQDVRHIEETRHISYTKVNVTQDGQLVPIDGSNFQLSSTAPSIEQAAIFNNQEFKNQQQAQQILSNMSQFGNIFFTSPQNGIYSSNAQEKTFVCNPQPTQNPIHRLNSSIHNVMECSKNLSSSPAFPFHYTESTSTTDLSFEERCRCCRRVDECGKRDKSCSVKEVSCCGINTDHIVSRDDDCEEPTALEKLKFKKMNDSSSA